MEITFSGLVWLENSPLPVWTQHAPPLCTGILGIFGALCILLPGGFPARALGGILLLPLFLVSPEKPPEKTVRITVFDVGQGLSVAAQTAEHSLLYDAGPVDGIV